MKDRKEKRALVNDCRAALFGVTSSFIVVCVQSTEPEHHIGSDPLQRKK